MNGPRDDNPPTLDYAPPPRRAMKAGDVVALLVGVFGGIVSMVFLAALIAAQLRPQARQDMSRYVFATIFFLLGIAAGVARLKAGRSPSPSSDRYVVMGLCFGWFITAMIAGVGFAVS